MNTELSRMAVLEWAISNEAQSIVLGLKYADGLPIKTLIIQIAEEGSVLAKSEIGTAAQGIYVEIDGHGFYRGVRNFKFDDVEKIVRLELKPNTHKDIGGMLKIEIPTPLSTDHEARLKQFERSYLASLIH